MTSPKIVFEKVLKAYGALKVLEDLDFHVDEGEVVAIIGPSGSGKTTVLRGADDPRRHPGGSHVC